MDNEIRVPVTAAVFAAMAVLLSGCMAYDAVSTVASVGGSVVRTSVSAVSTTGDIVSSPFDSDEPEQD
jgi:starvation-inducible outer membrane lipoprotein